MGLFKEYDFKKVKMYVVNHPEWCALSISNKRGYLNINLLYTSINIVKK